MRPGDPFFRVMTILPGIGFCLLSGFGIVAPALYVKLLGVSPISPSLASHFRYLNVLFLSYGVMLFLLAKDGRKHRMFLAILAVGMIGGAAVRVMSILMDGLPNVFMMIALVGELMLGVLYLISYRMTAGSQA